MHPNRRRKKRPNYGLRTVEVLRGGNGFGFTISGQQPCILSCIVSNSPAEQSGLRAGDFLISVNGISVSKMAHDAVVGLIGNCVGPIRMTIAENYYSDSSDDESECGRMVTTRKPKYMQKPRHYRPRPHNKSMMKPCNVGANFFNVEEQSHDLMNVSNPIAMEEEAGPIEFKVLIGYLGTIEMPKQVLPNCRLQTVCSCIRKLRQEKRTPTSVLMTILPTCLTLKNTSNHIIAIYPSNRVVYVSSSTNKDSRYFGLITSVDVSNSCHIFVVDSKIVDHRAHQEKANSFKVICTPDPITGSCLEFPQNALYIVNLIQTMYKLQNDFSGNNNPVANSPQPSASSNSDSGIGYRDDCGNISDRILVVEFPTTHRPLPVVSNSSHRPQGCDFDSIPSTSHFELNNKSSKFNNLNNVRATYENIKNDFENLKSPKQNNLTCKDSNKLTCRAMVDSTHKTTQAIKYGDVDSGLVYTEHPVDVPCIKESFNLFRVPLDSKKLKKQSKKLSSCESVDLPYNKLSPKVYGVPMANFSCEELNKPDLYGDKFGYGSLQDLTSLAEQQRLSQKSIAKSEPDVRIHRNLKRMPCDQNGGDGGQKGGSETSFEKLLEDPVGLHAFAEFLKKEFSAENIYFWTACERYRRIDNPCERAVEAQRIYKLHLASGAPEAVNVDSQGRQVTEKGLHEALDPQLFDTAQKQIFNLMKFDSYPRFLKSQLYKQCLNGEGFPYSFDPRLALQNASTPSSCSTPSKLKKSLSNAEDRRRKSILPWHRKNPTPHQRSKSRDRTDLTQKSWDGVLTVPVQHEDGRLVPNIDVHSSRSSLTSLDLAANQDTLKVESGNDTRSALCRVLLSNGSTTVVQIKEDETIQQLVNRLLEKRGLAFTSFEVFTNKHPKALDITEPSSNLSGCEVTVEQRVVFKLDLPNRKIISVKSKYTKIIGDVLRPILHKYKFSLDQVTVTRAGYAVDVNLPVTTIDNARLNIQLRDDCPINEEPVNPSNKITNIKISKLEEITNKVFEGILQEKSVGNFKPPKSDKGSVKSEDWGSEHSSGLLGKFLRRDSAMQEKKKKAQRAKTNNGECADDAPAESGHKKPLIAKLKAGANKLHVGTYSESDELVEGLTRAQRRLEDQRGTEINFELPDFLKDKEKEENSFNRGGGGSRFYTECAKVALAKTISTHPNYENQSVLAYPANGASPPKSAITPENSVLEKNPRVDPPPLPPKPKIIPIKPPNWGQGGFYKAKQPVPLEKQPEMFLEQPSSSFV